MAGGARRGFLPTAGQALALLALLVVVAAGAVALTDVLHALNALRDH
jgi:hypothetical protein